MTPHTRRGSIWQYIPLITQNVFHFRNPDEDQNSVPALILAADLPELLFSIIYNIKTAEDRVRYQRISPTAIDSLTYKVASLIDQGRLAVYLRDTRMRVDEYTPEHESDVFLVRLDDVERICSTEGIEISHNIVTGRATIDCSEIAEFIGQDECIGQDELIGQDGFVDDPLFTNLSENNHSLKYESNISQEEKIFNTLNFAKKVSSEKSRSTAEARATAEEGDDKPLGTRERNNVFRAFAGVCDIAGIDYNHASAAAATIVKKTQLRGQTVCETTIEKMLKEIPKAMEKKPKAKKSE